MTCERKKFVTGLARLLDKQLASQLVKEGLNSYT